MLRRLLPIATSVISKSTRMQSIHAVVSNKCNFSQKSSFNFAISSQQTYNRIRNIRGEPQLHQLLSDLNKIAEEERQNAIHNILQHACKLQLPKQLTKDSTLVEFLKPHSKKFMQDQLIRIHQEVKTYQAAISKQDKQLADDSLNSANKRFKMCFECLRNYVSHDQWINFKITLYKSFADYNMKIVAERVEPKHKRQVLQYAISLYNFIVKDVSIQIDYGRQALAKYAKQMEEQAKGEANFEKFKGEIHEYHDQLANISSQALVEIVSAYQLIKDIVSQQDTLDIYEKKISLLPDLEKGLSYYRNSNTRTLSGFYHPLKMIKIECNMVAFIKKINDPTLKLIPQEFQKESQQHITDLKEFNDELASDLKTVQNQANSLEMSLRLSTVLLTVQNFYIKFFHQDDKIFKERFKEERERIVKMIDNEQNRKIIEVELEETAKHMLQQPLKSK